MQIFISIKPKPNLRESSVGNGRREDDSTSNEVKDFRSFLFVKEEHEDFIIFRSSLESFSAFFCIQNVFDFLRFVVFMVR
jgi:hypothetical protein